MVTAKFSDVTEFLEELGKDRELVARRIVRVTGMTRGVKDSPNIRHLFVVATALVTDELSETIIQLDAYCGQVWGIESQDAPVFAQTKKVQQQIQDGCQALGLEVRDGLLVG